jgi:hypothetical protein
MSNQRQKKKKPTLKRSQTKQWFKKRILQQEGNFDFWKEGKKVRTRRL